MQQTLYQTNDFGKTQTQKLSFKVLANLKIHQWLCGPHSNSIVHPEIWADRCLNSFLFCFVFHLLGAASHQHRLSSDSSRQQFHLALSSRPGSPEQWILLCDHCRWYHLMLTLDSMAVWTRIVHLAKMILSCRPSKNNGPISKQNSSRRTIFEGLAQFKLEVQVHETFTLTSCHRKARNKPRTTILRLLLLGP